MKQTAHVRNEQERPPFRPMIPPLLPPTNEPAAPVEAQPMIYVHTEPEWQYLIRDYSEAETADLSEDDLATLGKAGWELVAIVPLKDKARFFFKRS